MTRPDSLADDTLDLGRLDAVPPLCPWTQHGELTGRRDGNPPTWCRTCSAGYRLNGDVPDAPTLDVALIRAGWFYTTSLPLGDDLADRLRAFLTNPAGT